MAAHWTACTRWGCPDLKCELQSPESSAEVATTTPTTFLQVVLEIKGETQLRNLASKLQEAGVQHKLWIEQPEGYATCLATAPCNKADVQQHFKKYQLARSKS